MDDLPPWAYLLIGGGLVWWYLHRKRPAATTTQQVAFTPGALPTIGPRPPGVDISSLSSHCPPGHMFLPARTGGGGHCIPIPNWTPGGDKPS